MPSFFLSGEPSVHFYSRSCLLRSLSSWYHAELIYPPKTGTTVTLQVVTSWTLLHAPLLPQTFNFFWQLDSIIWVHECVSLLCELFWEPGGGKATARVVVCYMESLSEPTEGSVPVKESSRDHCGQTPVKYETWGALWIMHKRDCFCHENVGFGPDVRMILLLLFF